MKGKEIAVSSTGESDQDYISKDVATEYGGQIKELQQQLLGLIEEKVRQRAVDEDFDERYAKIAEEIRGLKVKKLKMAQEQKLVVGYDQRLELWTGA